MAVVGTAYVMVRAVLSKLRPDIEKGVEQAFSKARPTFESVGERMGRSFAEGANRGLARDADKTFAGGAKRALETSGRAAGRGIGTRVSDGIGDGVNNRRGRLTAVLSRVMRSVVDAFRPDRSGNNAGEKFIGGLLEGISKFKLPGRVWLAILAVPALGGAVKVIAAYVNAIVSIVGALGPALAGAGFAAGAGVFSLITLMAALKIAFAEGDKAAADFTTRMKELGKESFGPVRKAIQEQLFPRLERALRTVSKVAPILRVGMAGVAKAVGDAAIGVSKTVTSSSNLVRLRNVLDTNAKATSLFGSALAPLTSTALILLNAARPLTLQLAAFAAGTARSANASALAAEQSGRLAAFIRLAGDTGAQVGRILSATFSGLGGVFRAAAGPGRILLTSIEGLASRFSVFANSAAGQNTLREFFASTLPIVHEVNGLIGDLFRLLGQSLTGNSDGVVAFIRTLRTEGVPAIAALGGSLARLGPALVTLTGALATLASALAQSGALDSFVSTVTTLANVLATVAQLPVVGPILGVGLAFVGAAKAVGLFLAPFGGLGILAAPFSRLFSALGGQLLRLGTFILPLVARGLVSLGTALFASPIGLAIAAIVALGVALFVAYKKSETFRGVINTIGSAIKTGFIAAVQFLQGVWNATWPVIVSGAHAIASGFQAVVGVVSSVVSAVVGFVQLIAPAVIQIVDTFAQPLRGLIQIAQGIFQVLAGVFTLNMGQINTGIANAIGGIIRLFFGMPARVLAALIQFGPTILRVVSSAMSAVGTFLLRALVGAALLFFQFNVRVGQFLLSLPGRIFNIANNAMIRLGSAIISGLARAGSFLAAFPGRAAAFIASLPGRLASIASSAMSRLQSLISTGVSRALSFFQALPGRIRSALGSLGGLLVGAGSALIDGLVSGIEGALGRALSVVSDLANKIKQKAKDALGIASPSKVFAEIGSNVGAGLVVGLKKSVPGVAAAGSRLALSAVPGTPGGALSFGAPGRTSGLAAAGAASVGVRVFIGDTELRGMIRTEVDDGLDSALRGAMSVRGG